MAANPAHQLEYALYDETDGLQQGPQTWQSGVGGVRGGDGRLWLASGPGIAVIDPRSLPPTAAAAAAAHRDCHRRRAARGARARPRPAVRHLHAAHRVRHGEPVVGVEAALPLHARGRRRRLGVRGQAREATYTNLPSGNYRFRVSTTARRAVDRGRAPGTSPWRRRSTGPPVLHAGRARPGVAAGGRLVAAHAGRAPALRAGLRRARPREPRDPRHAAPEPGRARRRARGDRQPARSVAGLRRATACAGCGGRWATPCATRASRSSSCATTP